MIILGIRECPPRQSGPGSRLCAPLPSRWGGNAHLVLSAPAGEIGLFSMSGAWRR